MTLDDFLPGSWLPPVRWSAGYPPAVKARIASSHGHLSNRAAADFLAETFDPRLSVVVLAHLSEESNTPRLARAAAARVLAQRGFRGMVEVALPDRPTPVFDLAELRERAGPRQLSLF